MADHSALSPTEAGMCLATSSVSPSTWRSCFSCASASGYCYTNVWYSDFSAESLFVQSNWYPVTGTPRILDTIFTFYFPPSSSEFLLLSRRAQTRNRDIINTEHTSADEYAVGTCKNMMIFHVTITPNILWVLNRQRFRIEFYSDTDHALPFIKSWEQ
jgi:hypothetical protein